MIQSYLDLGLRGEATFAVWVRRLPPDWGYLVAAGWPRVAAFAESLRFGPEDVSDLRSLGLFSDAFLGALPRFRFTGRMRALPEGCPFFAEEPILEVTAPLPEAQFLETFALNALQLPILTATKASRCVAAAEGRAVYDFAMRRSHGMDAARQTARSGWLAGMAGTSNVEAGCREGIPVVGTMAHSYVLAFASELEAFRAYARTFPDHCVLLVDTYDTLAGVRHAVQVGLELRERGSKLRGIRIDSGDLGELARQAREILDAAGLHEVLIIASGGLDERRIAALAQFPIDAFGVGTGFGVPDEAPTLDIVYKLVAYDGRAVAKWSAGKATFPGARRVWREVRGEGAERDLLGLRRETPPEGSRDLLAVVMEAGRPSAAPPSLAESRAAHAGWLREIPASCRRLREPEPYPVERTPALEALAESVREQRH